MTNKKLCDKLRTLRENNGFKQMEIAKILNCSRSTYTYYETGKTTPSISVLKLLAKIYNVSLMELLMDESEAGHCGIRVEAIVLTTSNISMTFRQTNGCWLAFSVLPRRKKQEEILQSANDICGLKK